MCATEQIHARDPDDVDSTGPSVAVAESLTGGMLCSAHVAVAALERVIVAPIGTPC
jgi:nicotinamide mononucleotide (NMN) deamidase PncC